MLVSDETMEKQYPQDVGIIGMEVYFPKLCVDQAALEKYDNVSMGKYTIGLGQTSMAFCNDREDINSICLTVVQSLMEKYNISYSDVGRLEVGTETIIDKSKSVKSVLMQLFEKSGNYDVEGVDTTNACYGGTSALFNALNWIESSSWDGRYAIVVAGDIAVYATGNARPTGGAGVVAILLGKNAPIAIERGLRGTHMEHTWDFFKPDLSSEFPQVDGPLTIVCYLRALDRCYQQYLQKLEKVGNIKNPSLKDIDYFVFHSPYTKLVQKSFARLVLNDFLRNPDDPEFSSLQNFRGLKLEDTYFDKNIEKAFMEFSKESFNKKVMPSLFNAKMLGNMYCGTVYGGLVSLACQANPEELLNKRVALFSYGSGLASSIFSFEIRDSTESIAERVNLHQRMKSRTVVDPAEFVETMKLREHTHNLKSYKPVSPLSTLFPGTYCLDSVDDKFRRHYIRVPFPN